eukprot:TRINITY_DN2943_c0_g1_i1.p1 TRINITY_DN2943_c0_g1~~TRINITY_DN2943_c0_g1_i1.p1  ORF type:complete len:496 (+),score=89.82 TRINITY_DN2943_c0_g1_i1:1-1488(+)
MMFVTALTFSALAVAAPMARVYDPLQAVNFIGNFWNSSVQETFFQYLEIPLQSPSFDPAWETNGYMDTAADLLVGWLQSQGINGLQAEVVKEPGYSPLIFCEIPASRGASGTVLMYGHADKQPPMTDAWSPGKGPYTPVIEDMHLYARGSADDGYALFGAISAVLAARAQSMPHARIVLLVEFDEESGSSHFPFYLDLLEDRIGTPDLVICLDSGAGNFEQMFVTTSLRGLVAANLRVDVLESSVHSGTGGGIIADTFRNVRLVMDRIEDVETGELLIPEFYCPIPEERVAEAATYASVIGTAVYTQFPFVDGVAPITNDVNTLVLNRSWRPSVAITGVDGFPAIQSASNVIRPYSTLRISIRLPPLVNSAVAAAALVDAVATVKPRDGKVTLTIASTANGWNAPQTAPWLETAMDNASRAVFGSNKGVVYAGEGGSIPFMSMLGSKFPNAQFFITGLIGPGTNAHAGDESLNLQYLPSLLASISSVLVDHAARL